MKDLDLFLSVITFETSFDPSKSVNKFLNGQEIERNWEKLENKCNRNVLNEAQAILVNSNIYLFLKNNYNK